MTPWPRFRSALVPALWLLALTGGVAADVKPPATPAKVAISVAPDAVAPGGVARVRLGLAPIPGVKINRYPKVKLEVLAQQGLVGPASASVGDDAPPALDKMKSNYFDGFDGLELELTVDSAAHPGRQQVEGKLTYFYCMPESGFCAPHRAPVTIPLNVR